ncbi:MAG: hypothetical protein B6241_10480 [Spirochaetaceae bacterium 4572_59]|nr:MAG: hypothetical protein B6241_10480 [Spirochaetaceae bacterium 4572_59]
MKTMTKKERVLRTLNFQETDRTAVYDVISGDHIAEHYNGAPLTPENGWKAVCLAAKETLDMTRMLRPPTFIEGSVAVEGEYEGYTNYHQRWTNWIEKRPYNDQKAAEEWIKKHIDYLNNWKADRTYAEWFHQDIINTQKLIGDDTVIVRESPVGFDSAYIWLGLEMFTFINLDNPELIDEYLEALVNREIKKAQAVGNPEIMPVALTYSDIAYKGSLLFSGDQLRKQFIPRLKRLVDTWHETGTKCLFHSDGDLKEILPDLVTAGIDGLNPIEKAAGLEMKEVVDFCGDKIFMAGGIDVSTLLPFGTEEEVRAECRKMIDIVGPGYFIGSTTELHPTIPAENILAMIDVAHNYKRM